MTGVALPAAGRRRELSRWADVDASAIRHNLEVIRRVVGERVAVMAMVKAAGYGHGAALTAAAALEGGATWLGVSSAEEALQLRAEGFSAPLLVVGAAHPAHLDAMVAAGVQITVWDPEQVAAVAAAAGRGLPARIHLKIDSGIGCFGAPPEAVPPLIRAVERAGARVEPVAAFTHFADAEDDPDFTSGRTTSSSTPSTGCAGAGRG